MTRWIPPENLPAPEAAQAWLMRSVSGEMTEDELRQWRLWRAADPAHEAALRRVQAVWEATKTMAPAFATATQNTGWLAGWAPRPALGGLLATAAVAAVAILALGVPFGDWFADYRTAPGEIARVTLPDGSSAWLDTQSALKLHYANGERRVSLLHGQAWFEVRHDTRHPFRVEAAGGSATDIGTVFDLRADDGRVKVAVATGAVRVNWGGENVLLKGGQAVSYGADAHVSQPTALGEDAMLDWRQGRLIFVGKPLGHVLGELSRYRRDRIVLLADGAAAKPVNAIIEVARLDAGLDALAETQNLRIIRLPFVTLLTAQK